MKVVYRTKFETYLNGERINYGVSSCWHYGELPESGTKVHYDTFEEFYAEYGYENKTLFRHEPYVALSALKPDARFTKIKKTDFKTFQVINTYREVDYKFSMRDLLKQLSAEDFIAYCKDHGLNACPIMKG